LATTTVGVAVLLGVTGYAQTWLPDRSAEVTDALLALLIGLGFALLNVGQRGAD
jgi:hypothetical protein